MEEFTNEIVAPETTNNTRSAPPSVASIVIDTTSHGGGFAPTKEKLRTFPIEVTVDLNNSPQYPIDFLIVLLTFAWDPDISPAPAPKVVTLSKHITRNTKSVKLFDEVEFKDLNPGTDYHMEMSAVAYLINNPLNYSTNYVRIKWKS